MKYHFKCSACGTEKEVDRSMRDTTAEYCKKCQSVMYQVYKPVGIIYKGNGFYKTDYKKKEK